VSPSKGIGDDPKQAVTPEALRQIIADAKALWTIRRKSGR
jgi:3-deoxy-7-phosphoheptulonate synthase